MTATHYVYQSDRVSRAELDEQGHIVHDRTEVTVDKMVSNPVSESAAGITVRTTSNVLAEAAATDLVDGEDAFPEEVLITAFKRVFGGGGTIVERFLYLH